MVYANWIIFNLGNSRDYSIEFNGQVFNSEYVFLASSYVSVINDFDTWHSSKR